MEQVDLVAQFLAIRKLHRLRRSEPDEDPVGRLSTLTRAYANLGLMTETNWGATSNVFKSRALLYAQRLAHQHPGDPVAALTYAYAYAWMGAHQLALTKLKSAGQLDGGAPTWAKLIKPCCDFDTRTIRRIRDNDSDHSDWATLHYAWARNMEGDTRAFADTGLDAMAKLQGAFGLGHLMMRGQSIGVVRTTERLMWQNVFGKLPTSLAGSFAVPRDIVAAAQRVERQTDKNWVSLLEVVRNTKSPGELSWSALAAQLEELAMAAANITYIAKTDFSTEQDLLRIEQGLTPLVGQHPNGNYLRVRALQRSQKTKEFKREVQEFCFIDPNDWQTTERRQFSDVKNKWGKDIWRAAERASHFEMTCHQLAVLTKYMSSQTVYLRRTNAALRKISPSCPRAIVNQIRFQLSNDKLPPVPALDRWQTQAADHWVIWYHLGRAYARHELADEAIACYECAIELNPSSNIFINLANLYVKLGQTHQFVPTLERYLEYPDRGIGHEKMKERIARHLIENDDVKRARQYAIEAAQAYAQSTLEVAAYTCELLHEPEQADPYYQAVSRSYPSSSGIMWYCFRQRQGRDNLEETRPLALRYLGPRERWFEAEHASLWPAAYLMMEGDHQTALRVAEKVTEQHPFVFIAAFTTLLADRVGDTKIRKKSRQLFGELLSNVEDSAEATPGWNTQLLALFDEIASGDAKDESQRQEIGRRVMHFLTQVQIPTSVLLESGVGYILGTQCQQNGLPDVAEQVYLWSCQNTDNRHTVSWNLAAINYQKLAGKPPTYRHSVDQEEANSPAPLN